MEPKPAKHARRSIRLKGYDYSQPGIYFVTICTHGGKCALGSIRDETVELSLLGTMIEKCWLDIPRHFPGVELGPYVIMPNHLHGVIGIVDTTPLPGRGEAFGFRSTHSSSIIGKVRNGGNAKIYSPNASPLQSRRRTS